jgi:hypothetical protein
MSTPARTLLLVGSAKRQASNSAALAAYLAARLGDRGCAAETRAIAPTVRSEADRAGLLAAIDAADLLVLAFPLFVDSQPTVVAQLMEEVAARRAAQPAPRPQHLAAVVNSGFPEARQSEVALAICRLFARQAGFAWAGGLALGAGEMIGGRELDRIGGMVRNVTRALDLAATALAAGQPIPREAVELMAKRLCPRWLYLLGGEFGWRREARRHRTMRRLRARPYDA